MSAVRMSGSTRRSVSAIGFCPAVTTNRTCLPHASQRKAMVLPSGDQAGADGYRICEMRSMVMLPRGDSVAAETASDAQAIAQAKQALTFMSASRKSVDGVEHRVRVVVHLHVVPPLHDLAVGADEIGRARDAHELPAV